MNEELHEHAERMLTLARDMANALSITEEQALERIREAMRDGTPLREVSTTRTRIRLRGTVRDGCALTLERLPPVLQVERAVQRAERRELLERAARLRPQSTDAARRYAAAHDHVTGRDA